MKADQRKETETPTEFKILLEYEYSTLEFRTTREETTNKQKRHSYQVKCTWLKHRKKNQYKIQVKDL